MSAEQKRKADERFTEMVRDMGPMSVDDTWEHVIEHYDWLMRRLAEGGAPARRRRK